MHPVGMVQRPVSLGVAQQHIDAGAKSALLEALQKVVAALNREAATRPYDLDAVSELAIDGKKELAKPKPNPGKVRAPLSEFGSKSAYAPKLYKFKPSSPVAVALGLALLSGGLATILLSQSVRPQLSPYTAPSSEEVQVVSRASQGWSGDAINDFREPVSPSSGFMLRLQLTPPFDAIDSTLFDTHDMRVRLTQALPVGRSDICTDDGGRRFACGLMGRAALQNFVQNQSVACDRFFLAPGTRRTIVDARCWLNGEDLAEHQIRAGFAFPAELAGDRHRQAMNEAKSQRSGVWAGPYTIPQQDRSEEDARIVPFGSTRLPETESRQVSAHPVAPLDMWIADQPERNASPGGSGAYADHEAAVRE